MSSSKPSARDVAVCVLQAWQDGADDEAVVGKLVALGLDWQAAAEAVELVRSGTMRAGLLAAGLPANQISPDVDDDPVFRAAVEAGQANLAAAHAQEREAPQDVASLSAGLADNDVEARRIAAYELGQSRDPDAVAYLLRTLDDPDTQVRIYAIQSLKALKAKSAVGPLSGLLGSGAPQILLVNAIKALVEIGDPAAVPALIDAARHENAFVRHDAAWALGELRDERAIPALEALLSDKTVPVEQDELGLTSQTSIYSVADHARQSLEKIRAASSPRSPGRDLAMAVVWTAVGSWMLYAHFVQGILGTFGMIGGVIILIGGVLGLVPHFARALRRG